MYQANLVSQGQQHGMLLVSHQGELQPNSQHYFQPKEAPFLDYSLSLVVAPDACTGYPTRIVGNIEGRDIVLNIPRLQMMTPSAKAYRPNERYVLTFTSILDASTLLEFAVSLILDGNPRVERHYLGIKPDHLPEVYEPPIQGPWYHSSGLGEQPGAQAAGLGLTPGFGARSGASDGQVCLMASSERPWRLRLFSICRWVAGLSTSSRFSNIPTSDRLPVTGSVLQNSIRLLGRRL